MKTYSNNFEIRNAVITFLDLFNDIYVYRKEGNERKKIYVKTFFGNKNRINKFIENISFTQTPPVIAVEYMSIARDSNRVSNLNEHLKYLPDIRYIPEELLDNYYNKFPGNPVNIEFRLSIFCKYRADLEQILNNFISFFNPSVYVVTPHPKINPEKGIMLKHCVVWSGNVNIDYNDNLDDRIKYNADTSFTFKTWIFPGEGPYQDNNYGVIEKINFFPEIIDEDDYSYLSSWYPVDKNTLETNYEDLIVGMVKLPYYDKLTISGDIKKRARNDVVSGYWIDISAAISGEVKNMYIPTSAEPIYLVTDHDNLLIISNAAIITKYSEQIDLIDLMKKYNI